MAQLEELKVGALVQGLLPGKSPVTLLGVTVHADVGVEVVYKDVNGHLGSELLYLDAIVHLQVAPKELPWRFDADGALFRLVSEAYRIRLAYLFDPLIAVHTSSTTISRLSCQRSKRSDLSTMISILRCYRAP